MVQAEESKQLAAALGRIPSGLFIMTARQGDTETGMLASWVQQCSFVPPLICLALSRKRPVSDWLNEGTVFALNILDDSQTDMISHFGLGFNLDEPAFTYLEITRSPEGLTILAESLAYLECRVVSRYPSGDHDLVIGHVISGKVQNEGHPMVHVRKSGLHY
jgi:flavin reductase (DIM6/NTAB) family NADH-FMN oxidoreductase RutF